ncbi:hypothetical protein P0M11_02125 [Kaistella sp. PBT33-4]|uniref:hypothetical protein n=1 Tax=Kaistella sp. PBT33-4 TaxID=3032000 RepID=UPI0023D89E96|nr:hypothetical protein [Kaistella sp. PBT33-4]MDF0718787.1 hypothetical protein [Kaistella sp. PBT33-4]
MMLFDFIYIPIILILGFLFINLLKDKLTPYDKKMLQWLWIFHIMTGVYFCFFIEGDAFGYWEIPKSYTFEIFKNEFLHGDGTSFMNAFNYIFTNLLGMSYLSNTLLYSLFGFIGLTFFYLVALLSIPYNKVFLGFAVFPLVFFSPNLHFWSAGVGKDTILFLCVGMLAYALTNPAKRVVFIIISISLSFAIRPHITLFLLFAFGSTYVFGGRIPLTKKIIFSTIFLGLAVAILPTVMTFVSVDSTSVEAISKRAASQAGNLAQGAGSAVDISEYPYVLKVLTFLYRPFFFDSSSIAGLIASIENLLLVFLTIKAFIYRPLETFRKAPFVLKGLFVFLAVGVLAFAPSLGNLGVMIRMRNMFLPGMLLYFMWCYSYQIKNKYSRSAVAEPK